MEAHGHKAFVVNTKEEALELLKTHIPKGASVHNASSTTLVQISFVQKILISFQAEIGFVDYLKTQTEWDNLHGKVLAEADQAKAADLRRKASTADYFLSSVSAVTENGEIVCVHNVYFFFNIP